jgi:cephalosporin hydroxylase
MRRRFRGLREGLKMDPKEVVREFHKLYYHSPVISTQTHWLGVPVLKCPLDLWIYQDIIFQNKPDVIVEAGTHHGGSAFYMASIFDLVGKGHVITMDVVDKPGRPRHQRITYLKASSTEKSTVDSALKLIGDGKRVTVVLDSEHDYVHVSKELVLWSKVVSVGQYLIVEDTNIGGNPVLPQWANGPFQAIKNWGPEKNGFSVDHSKEKFLMTLNPGGYLKRVR